jgi:tryptophan 2,3-dioxygenase
MANSNAMNYAGYLRLETLLELQQPVSAKADDGGELFFIVAHQASELWLKSLLTELEELDDAIVRRELPWAAPMLHARRGLAAAKMLVTGVEALRSLDAETFMRFRDQLGNASGLQSTQFGRLRLLMGLGRPSGGPIEANLRALAESFGVYPFDAEALGARPRSDWYWLVDTLLELSSTVWRWGIYHIEVARRLIGERSGTGGTSGVHFLMGRMLDRPFPTLWRSQLAAARRDPPSP